MAASFYHHFQADPYYNMAFDEWLLGRALAEPGQVFLRLYSWRIGTITIGFNQHFETACDHTRLGDTPVIRRITGGRALYHDPGELTYSIAAHIADRQTGRLSGSLSQVSVTVAEALVGFLAQCGIEAVQVRRSSSENAAPAFFHKAPCFASLAKYEVVGPGGKVVASAQKRIGADVFLQHGSIKLHGVAPHPALNPEVDSLAGQVAVADVSEFARVMERFRLAMSMSLNLVIKPARESGESEEFLTHLETVQKNPLARREVIKQSKGASSL